MLLGGDGDGRCDLGGALLGEGGELGDDVVDDSCGPFDPDSRLVGVGWREADSACQRAGV